MCVQEVAMTKNITLRMDEQLLKDVKHIAVEKDMSVSAWITQVVEKEAKRDLSYDAAATGIMRLMEEAKDYGDGGKTYTRDEMHER
jgi:predicted transcriptional regulator